MKEALFIDLRCSHSQVCFDASSHKTCLPAQFTFLPPAHHLDHSLPGHTTSPSHNYKSLLSPPLLFFLFSLSPSPPSFAPASLRPAPMLDKLLARAKNTFNKGKTLHSFPRISKHLEYLKGPSGTSDLRATWDLLVSLCLLNTFTSPTY